MIFGFLSHECAYLIQEYEYPNTIFYIGHDFHLHDWRPFLKKWSHRSEIDFLFSAGWPCILIKQAVPPCYIITNCVRFQVFKDVKKNMLRFSYVKPVGNLLTLCIMEWRIIVIFLTVYVSEFVLNSTDSCAFLKEIMYLYEIKYIKNWEEINFLWICPFALKNIWFWLGNTYYERTSVYILNLVGSIDVYKLLKHHFNDLEIMTEGFLSFLISYPEHLEDICFLLVWEAAKCTLKEQNFLLSLLQAIKIKYL